MNFAEYGVILVILLIISVVIAALRKALTGKTKKVHAIALEGQGLIKKIIEMDLAQDGTILKNPMINKQVTIVTSPVIFEKGNKKKLGYVVDWDKGCTVDLQKAGSVTALKTNPELVANVLDSRLIQDAFGIRPYRGMLVAVFLVAAAIGFIFGLAF